MQTRYLICEAQPKHMWDDFNGASVLGVDFSKHEARAQLSELAQRHPTVVSFTIAKVSSLGMTLVSGPTSRRFLIDTTKEN